MMSGTKMVGVGRDRKVKTPRLGFINRVISPEFSAFLLEDGGHIIYLL